MGELGRQGGEPGPSAAASAAGGQRGGFRARARRCPDDGREGSRRRPPLPAGVTACGPRGRPRFRTLPRDEGARPVLISSLCLRGAAPSGPRAARPGECGSAVVSFQSQLEAHRGRQESDALCECLPLRDEKGRLELWEHSPLPGARQVTFSEPGDRAARSPPHGLPTG